jgi:hypothetical protein
MARTWQLQAHHTGRTCFALLKLERGMFKSTGVTHLIAVWAEQVQHRCLTIHQLHLARIPHTHAEATRATCTVARQHHIMMSQQQKQQR